MSDPFWKEPRTNDDLRVEIDAKKNEYSELIGSLSDQKTIETFLFAADYRVLMGQVKIFDPFMSYLAKTGNKNARTIVQKNPSGLDEISGHVWKTLCQRLLAENKQGALSTVGAVMVSKAFKGLTDLEKVKDGNGGNVYSRYHERISAKNANDAVKELFAGQMDLGPGFRETVNTLGQWLETHTDEKPIVEMSDMDHQGLLNVIAAKSAMAGVRDNAALMRTLGAGRVAVDLIENNEAFNEDGWKGLMDEVLRELDLWASLATTFPGGATGGWKGLLTQPSVNLAGHIYKAGRSKGWELDETQRMRLETLSQYAYGQLRGITDWLAVKPAMGPGSQGTKFQQQLREKWSDSQAVTFTTILSDFDEAGEDNTTRKLTLLSCKNLDGERPPWRHGRNEEAPPRTRLLNKSSGNLWAEVASAEIETILRIPGHSHAIIRTLAAHLAREIAQAQDWNLHGLTKTNLETLAERAGTGFGGDVVKDALVVAAKRVGKLEKQGRTTTRKM